MKFTITNPLKLFATMLTIVFVSMVLTTGASAAGVNVSPTTLFTGIGSALTAVSVFSLPSTMLYSALTCGELVTIQGKMDQLWNDAQPNREYMPNSGVLQAIIANQTANIDPLVGQQGKDNVLKVTWIKSCPSDPTDITGECNPDGEEDTLDCQEYSPTIAKQLVYQVKDNVFRTNSFNKEEFISKGLAKRLKLMDEYLASQAVAFLEDSEGVSLNNWVGDLGTQHGTTVGNSTIAVAPAYWTADLMGYLVTLAQMNKFDTPYLISGANLQAVKWNAEMSAANADGKGDFNKISALPMTNDPWNVDTGFTYQPTFLLNKGAIAFGAKWWYGNTPQDMGGSIGMRYSVASPSLPGVRYDIHYNVVCLDGSAGQPSDIVHKFTIIARGGFYLNPVGCEEKNTGILHVEKRS